MRRSTAVLALAGALALGGGYLALSRPSASPVPATPVPVPQEARRVVDLAIGDLAQRLGLSREEIRVALVEAVDWPDTSLGHPQPGMMYLQVITPGFRVVLEAAGKTFEYHTDYQRMIFVGE